MKYILFLFFLICVLIIFSPSLASAHKLIPTDGSNNSIDSALLIPDHKISWAMYEELDKNVLYYKFDAKKGDKFFASIVIPKLDDLERFTPSLAFIGPSFSIELIEEVRVLDSTKSLSFSIPNGYDSIVIDYNGILPSKEFYEPFGQITYWERQEINFIIPVDAVYYLAVYDSSNNSGKLALAVGTIEDFSLFDFFTVLPTAWFESRYFVEDYTTPTISLLIIIGLIALILVFIYKKLKRPKLGTSDTY